MPNTSELKIQETGQPKFTKIMLWKMLVVTVTQITLKIHQHPIRTNIGILVLPTPRKTPQIHWDRVKNK